MSFQARETDKKHTFIAPSWARKFTKEDLPYRLPDMNDPEENFWYMELGGEGDTIHDTEKLRDELISVAYGIWDFVKNSGEYDADNWELEFVGFLPGKRESRRYVGDYIMNQNDVRDGGHFDDIAAYGGWTMDDHNPAGINTKDKPNIFHPAPSPFGIPYRCLYSVNIENLYFAGRNISVTHTAMSASRVMATCALLGQAVGTASAIAIKNDATPREISEKYICELQQMLMDDDCWLPYCKTKISELTKSATITSTGEDAELLLNGIERHYGDDKNCWSGKIGDTVTFSFESEKAINEVRFVFNSDLNRETTGAGKYIPEKMNTCNVHKNAPALNVPKTLVKDMKIEIKNADDKWQEIDGIKENHQRLVKIKIGKTTKAIRFTLISTNGNEIADIYSIDLR